MPYTLDDFAERFGARVEGDGSQVIETVASLERAGKGAISFYSSPRHQSKLATTNASAIILREQDLNAFAGNCLVASDPQSCFAKIASLLNPSPSILPGIHESAVVESSAVVAPSARIGPNTVIAADAIIGEDADIGPNCNIMEKVIIGNETHLVSGVSVYSRSVIGERCVIHAGAVIGADGFGLINESGKWTSVPQLGRVLIGNDVDIGANTCIDRGALDDTVIGDGVKLDNQIQIGHNVRIGDHTVMAAFVGVAGSVKIGKRCMLGGRASIAGHLEIGDDVSVMATSMVTHSLPRPGVYSSVMSVQTSHKWKRNAARLHRLDELFMRVKRIDEKVALLVKGDELE